MRTELPESRSTGPRTKPAGRRAPAPLAWMPLIALVVIGCQGDLAGPSGPGLGLLSLGQEKVDEAEDHYSILLYVLTDPATHVQAAEAYKKALSEKVGWKGLFVVHKAGRSELYWGRYNSPEQAQKNLRTAKAYRTLNGTPLFAQALVVPLPGKDIGPREWNLRNATGEYTLLVAVFKDVRERNYVGRRRFAVKYCRQLRERNYDAYYWHGPAVSHVTIGSFSANAVRVQDLGRGRRRIDILDPRIKALQKDFPRMAFNGVGVNDIVRSPDGRRIRIPRKTVLVRIPRGEPADER